jgi:hypothetical protein
MPSGGSHDATFDLYGYVVDCVDILSLDRSLIPSLAYHNERSVHGGSTNEESGMGRSRWWKETVRRGWDEDDVECCKAVKAGSQSERVFVSVAVL